MSKLSEGLPVTVVLMLCFMMVQTAKCKSRCDCQPRCDIELQNVYVKTCEDGKVCKMRPDGIARCDDYDDPAKCLPRLNRGKVDSCILGPHDVCTCTVNEFGSMASTNVEVINPSVCKVKKKQTLTGAECRQFCNNNKCLYYKRRFSNCIVFKSKCEIRATRAGPVNVIYYRKR